jgi:hypothetical protein
MAVHDELASWLSDFDEQDTAGFRVAFVDDRFFMIERVEKPLVTPITDEEYSRGIGVTLGFDAAQDSDPTATSDATVKADGTIVPHNTEMGRKISRNANFLDPARWAAREQPQKTAQPIRQKESVEFMATQETPVRKPVQYARPEPHEPLVPGQCSVCWGTGKMRDNSECRTCDGRGNRG